MNIRILGYSGGYPGAGVPTSGYLISFERKNILVDCGSGVLAELQKTTPIECLDAIILSHMHQDHISDFSVLRYALDMKSKRGDPINPIPIFAPQSPRGIFDEIAGDTNISVSVIDSSSYLHIAGATITFHPTSHSVECYGIRVEHSGSVFSYSSDSSYDPSLFGFLSDSNLSILDCGGLSADVEKDKKHMTPADCFSLHNEFGIKRVVLSHLIPYHSVSETISEAEACGPWPFEIAEMGKVYIVL